MEQYASGYARGFEYRLSRKGSQVRVLPAPRMTWKCVIIGSQLDSTSSAP